MVLKTLLINCLFWSLFGAFVAGYCDIYLSSKHASYFAVFGLFMSFFLAVYALFCVGFQHSVVTISLFSCTCFQVLASTLDNLFRLISFSFVGHCDSGVVSEHAIITSFDFATICYKILLLFILFLTTLAIARYFFKSSITDTLAGNVISSYFFGFILYRVYYGWAMHPLIFTLVSFGFFFWAAQKNAYAFFKLYDYSPDPSAFRADIYKEMSEFNSGLSTYFFIISAPLLANIVYVIINVYVQGLMVGFNVTSEMIFSTVYWLEEICCFALAVISGLVYKMLSLSWDEDLFDLNVNTFHKLTAVLFLLPLSALFPILAFAFMNVCAKIYLISYLIYFSVGFIFLLTKRIELSSPSSGATAFFLEKLRLFYNFSSLLCGTFSLYLSSSFYEAIKAFALSVSGEGFIFISPAMVYAGAFNFFDLLTGGNGELFIVYNAWCWLMSCTFVLLIIFILAFFTAFNYEYGFNDGVSPLSGFFFRLICLSTSIAIFFLGGLGSDNSTTTLACSGFFFALEPKYSINLSNAKLCGYGFLSKGFMALCVAAGASTALFPEKAGAAALGFAAATGAIVGQAFLNHSGKASVDMYTQGNIVVKKAAVLQFKFETRVGDVFKNVKSHAEAERLALKLKYCPEFRQVTIQFLKARLSQELTHNFENNNNDSVFGTGNFRSYYCFTTQARDSGLLGLCPIYNNWFINSHPVFKGLINEVNLKTDHVAATIAAEADPLVPSVEIIASLKNFDAALVQPAGAASMKNVGTEKSSEHATYKSIKPLKGNTVKPLKSNTVKPLKGKDLKGKVLKLDEFDLGS